MLQGTFESDAVFSFHFRGGAPFSGTPGTMWRIYGEKGELSIEGDGYALSMGLALTVKLHDFETGNVEVLDVANSVEQWQKLQLPPMAQVCSLGCEKCASADSEQMIGLVYEAFYEGKGYVDFEHAVKRHRMIADIYAKNEK